MPKRKEITKLIPRIYQVNAENLLLFGWVKAQKQIVPTITIAQAILNFFRFAEISVDEWEIESAKTQYDRIQKDFYQDCRSETT